MNSALLELTGVEVDQLADGRFVVNASPAGNDRIMGSGLIVASLAAAATTVATALEPSALHVSFLRAGRVDRPLELTVTAVHDGMRTAHRRIDATQDDRAVASASLRFAAPQQAPDWHATAPPTSSPEDGDPAYAAVAAVPAMAAFEVRAAIVPDDGRPVIHPYWVRHREPLPTDPLTHAGLVAFISDIGVSGSARPPGTRLRDRLGGVTLDHSLWWHRHAHVDDWLLVTATSTTESAGRSFARGQIATRAGAVVASFAQDVLFAPILGTSLTAGVGYLAAMPASTESTTPVM